MNDLEERLRAVTRAAAGQIPSDGLQPLRLPAGGRLRRAAFRLTARMSPLGAAAPRWQRWLAPLATAAAVAGLVAGSITIAHTVSGHLAKRPAGAKTVSALPRKKPALPPTVVPTRLPAPPPTREGLPPYYAGLAYSAKFEAAPGNVMVSSTATGKTLATVTPPAGEQFTAVSPVADDRTFILAAETPAQVTHRENLPPTNDSLAAYTGPERFYLLRLSSSGAPSKPVPLNIPVSSQESGFAVSPDGTELAVARSSKTSLTLTVYTLATGASRTWTASTHQQGRYRYYTLALMGWTTGGSIGLTLTTPPNQILTELAGLLNTATSGGSLLADIAAVAPSCGYGVVSLNGHLLVNGALSPGNNLPWRLRECTYIHGRTTITVPGRELFTGKTPITIDGDLGPLWMSPDGTKMIMSGGYGKHWNTPITGTLDGNQVKPLPGSASIGQVTLFPGAATAW